jgi:hypothetical protein
MISNKLKEFVIFLNNKGFKIELKDRNSSDSWNYDGKTFALREGDRYYSDHDILHEIGHWFAANFEQLDLPEFGLAFGIVNGNAYGPLGGEFRNSFGELKYSSLKNDVMLGLVDLEEQNDQEWLAQQFCIYFGKKLGLSVKLFNEDTFQSWDHYEELKKQEWSCDYPQKCGFRFQEILNRIET